MNLVANLRVLLLCITPLVGAMSTLAQSDLDDAGPGVADAGAEDTEMRDGGTASEADAGAPTSSDPCVPRCVGDALLFCDGDRPVALGCTPSADATDVDGGPSFLGAVEGAVACARISEAHGDDCVLGAGAACDSDYARGLSRCDSTRGLVCLEGSCQIGDAPPDTPAALEPTPGTLLTTQGNGTTRTTSAGCGQAGSTSLCVLGGLVLLGAWRRRATQRRAP